MVFLSVTWLVRGRLKKFSYLPIPISWFISISEQIWFYHEDSDTGYATIAIQYKRWRKLDIMTIDFMTDFLKTFVIWLTSHNSFEKEAFFSVSWCMNWGSKRVNLPKLTCFIKYSPPDLNRSLLSLLTFPCPICVPGFWRNQKMYNVTIYSMAGEKCKSLYFYYVFASVIYLSECKLTQAMPSELLSLA